jgi:hypothetical protein
LFKKFVKKQFGQFFGAKIDLIKTILSFRGQNALAYFGPTVSDEKKFVRPSKTPGKPFRVNQSKASSFFSSLSVIFFLLNLLLLYLHFFACVIGRSGGAASSRNREQQNL